MVEQIDTDEHRCERAGCRGLDGMPNPTPRVLCEPCRVLLDRTLAGFIDAYVALDVELPNKGTGNAERIAKNREAPVPFNFHLLGLQDELVREIAECVVEITHVQDACPVRLGRQGPALVGSIAYVRRFLSVLLALPDAAERVNRILLLERRIQAGLGIGRTFFRLPTPCPNCDALGLVREDGAEHVDCRACGSQISDQMYAHFVNVMANELGTARRKRL